MAKAALWDVAFDALAVIVPGIPAGFNKLGRIGNSITKSLQTSRKTTKIASPVHGNSKLSTRPQHSYDILEIKTGRHVKIGVSGGRIRKDGKSVRAETQVRRLNRQACYEKYESIITHHEPGGEGARDRILEYEKKRSKYFWDKEEIDKNIHHRP